MKMKIEYWPNKPGIELNMKVSELFRKLYLKFNYNLYNETVNILAIDIINVQTKKEIFQIILLELEILVLDIIELDLDMHDLQTLNQKILMDLLNKCITNFYITRLNNQDFLNQEQLISPQIKNKILSEHKLLIEYLLNYLIFGTYMQKDNHYSFIFTKTPVKHIEILLDNLVIQIADIIFSEVMQSKRSLSNLFDFFISEKICSDRYFSTRSIATFRNNLLWSNCINFYIRYPKMIYNNRYEVWLFSTKGLQSQYIYANREQDLKHLCATQILMITLLELQDFIVPKITKVICLIGKINLTIFHNIIKYGISNILQSFILVTRYPKK